MLTFDALRVSVDAHQLDLLWAAQVARPATTSRRIAKAARGISHCGHQTIVLATPVAAPAA